MSALAVLDGCLLMAAGNRLELCAWNGSSLTRMAFFDGPLYITSVNVVKSFVLFGDLHKGIHFVWYTVRGNFPRITSLICGSDHTCGCMLMQPQGDVLDGNLVCFTMTCA